MSKETAIRIGGPAMILGGLLWLVANLGHMPMEYFGGIDFDPVWTFAFPPLLVGLYALTMYAGTSNPMQAAAWITFASGAAAYLGVLVGAIGMFLVSVLLMVLAMLIFGMSALREKPLPRWNGAALLMGTVFIAPIVLSALSSMGLLPKPEAELFANIALTTGFGLIGLCWVLLGCAMLPSNPQTAPAVLS